MTSEALQDLHEEFRTQGLGPQLQKRITRLVRSVAKNYPPRVYARVERWDEDAMADVEQDVFVDLIDGHLATIFDLALTVAGFDESVRGRTRSVLAQRKRRTVIDNLIDRCREAIQETPFVVEGAGGDVRFRLDGIGPQAGTQIPHEALRRAAQRVALLPRIPVRTVERAPRIYHRDVLQTLLCGVVKDLGRDVGLTDLRRILELALTDLAVRELQALGNESANDQDEEMTTQADQAVDLGPGMADPEPQTEDAVMAAAAVDALMDALDPEQLTVLRLKAAESSDQDVADALGLSRPTAAERKKTVWALMQKHLGPLQEGEFDAAWKLLVTRLVLET